MGRDSSAFFISCFLIARSTVSRALLQCTDHSHCFSTSFSLFKSSGLAICSFMPVFFASCTSSAKAYDVSKDANQNLQSLEQIRQNVDDEITDSQKAKKKLDQTKKLLDTLGVGKSLEKGVNKLDDHLQEATGLKGEVISAMQDLEKVYRQLDQI